MTTKKPKKKSGKISKPEARAGNPRGPEFPVVGIGASAGGLEALKELFENVPRDPGMAFVVVVHQHPDHTSLLPELLAKIAKIPVVEARQGVHLEPNRVYVAPPGEPLTVENGVLHMVRSPRWEGPPLPIDFFFRSLAGDRGEHSICVILSGTGSDGTLGLKAVNAAAGLVIVQSSATAKFSGMPSSAIETGMADYILAPADMPAQLMAYARGAYLKRRPAEAEGFELPRESLQQVLFLLKARTGNDFSSYKATTIDRRIERRMNVHQIKDPQQYVRFLEENPHELDILFKELLIRVTSFFRDAEAFEALAAEALPSLLLAQPEQREFRVWVPACTSGEEVYSIAIMLRECMDRIGKHPDVQIFGTDLDSQAVEAARLGRYGVNIEADVSAERLERWFIREENGYRVSGEIRDMAVFAVQNVIKDPPFSRLGLISCRNMLIYLKPDLQQKLLPLFHYALEPEGLLLLGPSETIGGCRDFFEVVDTKWKIFRRQPRGPALRPPKLSSQVLEAKTEELQRAVPAAAAGSKKTVAALIEQLLLTQFCPASVVVNERGDIIHIRGRTGAYLEPAEGSPRMNVVDMAREGLKSKLVSALRHAAACKDRAETVRRQASLRTNGEHVPVELSVSRLLDPEALRGLFMITFRPGGPPGKAAHSRERGTIKEPRQRASELGEELRYTKESLQTTIEEMEASNEELRSLNEELQSSNEEMQSANEELETSREEMQSLNEELNTVNAELQCKNDALGQANDDTQNLLNSTDIATIFLDLDLNIKRFTDQATNLIKLIPSDLGRPITDLVKELKYEGLESDCRAVLRTLVCKEAEVETNDGAWYSMRIIPYRTANNRINGLVLTFANTTQVKLAEQAARQAQAFFESIVETVREPLVVLDEALRVVTCNRSFSRAFGINAETARGELIYKLGACQWNVPNLRRLLEEILPRQTTLENFQIAAEFPEIGHRVLELNARRLAAPQDQSGKILLAMEDITDSGAVSTPKGGDGNRRKAQN